MAEFTFGDLVQSAAEAPAGQGGGPDLDAAGSYDAEVVFGNSKISSNNKLQVGIKFVVRGGPKDNHGIWLNQTLSPESPVALDIFFRTFEALGIPRDAWVKYGANLEAAGDAVKDAIVGAFAKIKVQMGKAQNGYDAKLEVKRVDRPSGAPQATAAAPGVGAVPFVPAPPAVPAFPQPTAAPVPPAPPAAAAPPLAPVAAGGVAASLPAAPPPRPAF